LSLVGAHAAGPRWIAEEVALGAGEATLSLEREMEQAYAAAGDTLRASVAVSPAVTNSEPPAVAAEPPLEESTAAVPVPEVAEQPVVYAMASAAGAGDAGAVAASAQLVTQDASTVENKQEKNQKEEVMAPVASSVAVDVPQGIAENEGQLVGSAAASADMTEAQIAGGAEEMVANWKNIRDSIAGAAPKRAPSKEDVPEVEPVKSEAEPVAAAPHDSAPAAADPRAIASIVDSVLAELRPRIVEEIARKLATDTKKD